MDTPALPAILTEADWNKKKGAAAKIAGKTGLGALLKELMLAYHRVDWDALDPDKALSPSSTAAQATAALAVARRQYTANFPPLLKKLEAVEEKARQTQAKFAKNKLIPAASAKHVGQLADAAEQLADDVKKVEDDHEEFEQAVEAIVKKAAQAKTKSKPLPTIPTNLTGKQVVGAKWFEGLAKISLHRDPAVTRWAFNADIGAAADDGLFKLDRRFDPRGAQERYETHLKKFRVIIERLRSLSDQKMERKDAVVKLQTGARDLAQAFEACLLSVGDLVEALKSLRGKAATQYETWHAAHPEVVKQSEQALAVLKKQQDLIEELDKFAQKLKKD